MTYFFSKFLHISLKHLVCLQIHMWQTLLYVRENLSMIIAGTHTCLVQVHLRDMIFLVLILINILEGRNSLEFWFVFQIQIYVCLQLLLAIILSISGMLTQGRWCITNVLFLRIWSILIKLNNSLELFIIHII